MDSVAKLVTMHRFLHDVLLNFKTQQYEAQHDKANLYENILAMGGPITRPKTNKKETNKQPECPRHTPHPKNTKHTTEQTHQNAQHTQRRLEHGTGEARRNGKLSFCKSFWHGSESSKCPGTRNGSGKPCFTLAPRKCTGCTPPPAPSEPSSAPVGKCTAFQLN